MRESEALGRRELFRVLGAGLAARHASAQHHEPGSAPPLDIASYQPRFFSRAQYETVDRLCDLIIPADDLGPGAHQAGVPFYIDTVLHYTAGDRQSWLQGLADVERAAAARFGRVFLECTASGQDQLIATMAANEGKPETDLEKFFGRLKALTIEAYCFSEPAQRDYFGYRGDTILAEFPGCTHPEHQR
jgi:hypothetical protein